MKRLLTIIAFCATAFATAGAVTTPAAADSGRHGSSLYTQVSGGHVVLSFSSGERRHGVRRAERRHYKARRHRKSERRQYARQGHFPRHGQRLLDRFVGNLVEHQHEVRHLRLEFLQQMPSDGLSLAVFVGGEIQGVGFFELVFQEFDLFHLAGWDDVNRGKIVVDVDAQIRPRLAFVFGGDLFGALGQIADVPDAGLHAEAVAQEFADGPGLGR